MNLHRISPSLAINLDQITRVECSTKDGQIEFMNVYLGLQPMKLAGTDALQFHEFLFPKVEAEKPEPEVEKEKPHFGHGHGKKK